MQSPTAFVAGATGYTGREVVRLLCEHGVDTVAHIRPDSSGREAYTSHFQAEGARIDTTPWDEEEMAETLERIEPDVVFCLIGTTRSRQKKADDPDAHSYEAVDYGLTALLVRACVRASIEPRFVYISAVGVGPNAKSAYMQARWKAERCVVDSELPHTVVRPSFISGPGRSDSRPAERIGAVLGDALLSAIGAVGFKKARDRYKSMTNTELAEHLVELALSSDGENVVLDAADLRNRTGNNSRNP